jgi:ParB/RepB/Spo0J family partition protein
MVRVDRLVPGHYSVRTEEPSKTFLDNVKVHGVIENIWVKDIENSDKKKIISGGRRTFGAREAKISELECLIYPANTPEEVCHFLSLLENLQREDLDASAQSKAIYELWILCDKDTKIVAHELGISPRSVEEWIGARQQIEALVKRGKEVDKRHIPVFRYIANRVPSYKQDEATDAIEGMTPLNARKTIKLILNELNGGNTAVNPKAIADTVRATQGKIGGTSLVVVIGDNDLRWAIEQAKAQERLDGIAEYLLTVAKRDCIAKGVYPPKQVIESAV